MQSIWQQTTREGDMKRITQSEGSRTSTGYHTGYALLLIGETYYISTESGTRKATKKEIAKTKK